jgi:hypothetical protein
MTRKRAAQTQYISGAARKDKTEERTGRKARPSKVGTVGAEPAQVSQARIGPECRDDRFDAQLGVQPEADALVSAARAAWLEMIRALARGAAQRDHDAAIREARSDTNKMGERE